MLLANRAVLGLVAAGLTEEPDGRALDRLSVGRPAERGALPRDPADEERPETLEMERRLLRLAHPLDDDRERVQLGPEQADDEVVVVAVEPVAREPDVVAEPGSAEGHPDAPVLHEDRVLLAARELLERAGAAQRVPDRPRQRRIEHAPARALDERLLEILLVADRVGAAEHRQLRLRLEARRTAATGGTSGSSETNASGDSLSVSSATPVGSFTSS